MCKIENMFSNHCQTAVITGTEPIYKYETKTSATAMIYERLPIAYNIKPNHWRL